MQILFQMLFDAVKEKIILINKENKEIENYFLQLAHKMISSWALALLVDYCVSFQLCRFYKTLR